MSYEQHVAEDRRLTILQALAGAGAYSANAPLLRRYVERFGHIVSANQIEHDLTWLREVALVTLRQADGITIATINVRGLDVATGRAKVPGVSQPAPGA